MTVSGGRELRRSVRQLKRDLDTKVDDVAEDGLDKTERRAKRNIVNRDAVATTQLYRSFVQRSTTEVIDGNAARRYSLTNTASHAPMVEFGTGTQFATGASFGFDVPVNPYAAPSFSVRLIAAIERWIDVKPGFRGERNDSPSRSDAIPIAYSIAHPTESDPETGTPPKPFMRPAWFVEKDKVRMNAKLAVMDAVSNF